MKITAIKTFLMHAGSPQLKSWAADGSFGTQVFSGNLTGTRNWLFVKVYTDEGVVGLGECSGWPRVIETAVQDLQALLIGEDPQHIERLLACGQHPRHVIQRGLRVRSAQGFVQR
jgi:galactonate dehydratase